MEETEERKRALELRKNLAGSIRKLWAEDLDKDNLKILYFLLGKVQETLDGRLDTLSIDGPAVYFETEDELKEALAVLDSDKDFDVDRAASGLSATVSKKLDELYWAEVRSAKTLPRLEVRRIKAAAEDARYWLNQTDRDSLTRSEMLTQDLAAALELLSPDSKKTLVNAAIRFQTPFSKKRPSDAEVEALNELRGSLKELELAASSAAVPVKEAEDNTTDGEQKTLQVKARAVVDALKKFVEVIG